MLFHIPELCYALACIRITAHDFHLFIFSPMTVNPFHFFNQKRCRHLQNLALTESAPARAWRVRIGACGGAAAGGLGVQQRLVRRGAGGGGAAGPEVPSPWCGAARAEAAAAFQVRPRHHTVYTTTLLCPHLRKNQHMNPITTDTAIGTVTPKARDLSNRLLESLTD
jgi:hypothetical protein